MFTLKDHAAAQAQATIEPFMENKVELLLSWVRENGELDPNGVNMILTLAETRQLAMYLLQAAAFVDERQRAHERERLRNGLELG